MYSEIFSKNWLNTFWKIIEASIVFDKPFLFGRHEGNGFSAFLLRRHLLLHIFEKTFLYSRALYFLCYHFVFNNWWMRTEIDNLKTLLHVKRGHLEYVHNRVVLPMTEFLMYKTNVKCQDYVIKFANYWHRNNYLLILFEHAKLFIN